MGIGLYGGFNMMLVIMTVGVGVFFAPLLLLFVISVVNKLRRKYNDRYGFRTLTFIAMSELPLFAISLVAAIAIISVHTPDGDILHSFNSLLWFWLALFCGITAMLVMLGTVICSISEQVSKSRKENYGLTEDR